MELNPKSYKTELKFIKLENGTNIQDFIYGLIDIRFPHKIECNNGNHSVSATVINLITGDEFTLGYGDTLCWSMEMVTIFKDKKGEYLDDRLKRSFEHFPKPLYSDDNIDRITWK